MRGTRTRRRGLISVVVLATLLILGILGVALLRVALARRAEVGAEERKLQALWLVESGLDRAAARLQASADYEGETWEIPAPDLGGRGVGRVAIRVEPVEDQPLRRNVHVRAEYPEGSPSRATRSRAIVIELRPPSAEVPRP